MLKINLLFNLFVIALGYYVSGVKLLLLSIYIWNNQSHDFFDVLDADKMWGSFWVFEEMNKAEIRPSLILEGDFP